MINSRNVNELNPKVKELQIKFFEQCALEGIDLITTSTYRDLESQEALYQVGRSTIGANPTAKKPMGDKLTNAEAGSSFHNYRVAFDVVPIVNGKAIWNDAKLWAKIGRIGKKVGLEWAGDWKSFKETAHFQYTGGLTLADFKAGKTL
jgi:peptidoglycan L-alanyl-D-glutamate endopeptidase CwlK